MLARILSDEFELEPRQPRPIRAARMMSLAVHSLEPRFVLNATAELSVLGELLVTGTEAADTIQLEVNAGGQLLLRDEVGSIVPIANHPDGPSGSTNGLDVSAITSGRIHIDMLGGDDVLDLQLPNALDVTVRGGSGDDATTFRSPASTSSTTGSLDVQSERISIDPRLTNFSSDGASHLVGNLEVGNVGESSRLSFANGIEIDGHLIISGNVALLSTKGSIDLSAATVSAASTDANLRITANDNLLRLGSGDDFGGRFINNLVISSASSIDSSGALTLDGAFIVRNVTGTTLLDAPIVAHSVNVVTEGDINVRPGITVHSAGLTLSSQASLGIAGELNSTGASNLGAVNLAGESIRLTDTIVKTSGGVIDVSGLVEINGSVTFDSGNDLLADSAANISFNQRIVAGDSVDDTLAIFARGVTRDGAVRLPVTLDNTFDSPVVDDLNDFSVDAGRLESNSLGVKDGDIRIVVDTFRLFGNRVGSPTTNWVRIDGELLLPTGDTVILASGTVNLSGSVIGQNGTNNLRVAADSIQVESNINTPESNLQLRSQTLTLISGDADVDVGNAIIDIDGGSGVIDTRGATLRSDAVNDAILMQNASEILLGNSLAVDGKLFVRNIVGPVSQAPLTRIVIDRIDAETNGPVELSNQENEIREVQRIQSGGNVALTDSTGDLLLTLIDTSNNNVTVLAAGDIFVTNILAGSEGDIQLTSGDDVLDTDTTDTNLIVSDDLILAASNRNAEDGLHAIRIVTSVNDIQARVSGANRGDIEIDEIDDINLAASDFADDTEQIIASNGQIIVRAVNITISDSNLDNDGIDRKNDPEIIARGNNGRIDLRADNHLMLTSGVQLHSQWITRATAEPKTQLFSPDGEEQLPQPFDVTPEMRSVYLQADQVILGSEIEIYTGDTQGTARVFSPRPMLPPLALMNANNNLTPAFFDPRTVTVNILEQALFNDATGILSFKIGSEGEKGLVVEIDWGAVSRRYQEITGLDAELGYFVGVQAAGDLIDPRVVSEGGRLTVEHFFMEKIDILNSTENGRASATDRLNVQFSVRQHDSIFVRGNSILQNAGSEAVSGGVISSTDNPLTNRGDVTQTGTESGRASFIIPSLSIPVAFFPVRDVIPEVETVEFVVRPVTTTGLSQTSVTMVESVVTTAASREEFFQLRALSPDPGGEDLIEPRELPPDILEGTKIQQLFKNLPDGMYEIEYVLGNGNERSLLRFEVRGGEAIVAGGELDEGALELKRVDDDVERE